MTQAKRLFALIPLLVVVSVLLSFSYGYVPTIDTPNTGDETMSMTMAQTGFASGHPSFGYWRDGTPRRLPTAVLMPVTQYLYGSVMAELSPFERIGIARLVSRWLNAFSLALSLIVLVLALPKRARLFDWLTATVCAGCLFYMFLLMRSFCYVGSTARYDAAGLLAVSFFSFLAVRFIISPRLVNLALAGAWAALCLLVNHIPFLFGLAGYASLCLLWLMYRRGLWRLVGMNALLLAVCGLAMWLFARGVMDIAYVGEQRISFGGLTERLLSHASGMVSSGPFAYLLEIGQRKAVDMMAAGLVIGVFLCGSRLVRRASPSPEGAGAVTLQSQLETVTLCIVWPLMTAAIAHALPHPRFTYEPMLLIPVSLPLFVALLRSPVSGGLRFLLATAVFVVLCVLHTPYDVGFRGKYLETSSVSEGFRGYANPPSWNQPDVVQNYVRAAHLRHLMDYLDETDAGKVLAFDPMLALFDGDGRQVFYLWDAVEPEEEGAALERFVRQFGVGHAVMTRAAGATWLSPVGLPRFEAALLEHASAEGDVFVEVPGGRITASPVYVTHGRDDDSKDVEYAYSHAPSTPLTVFRLSFEQSPTGAK